ncbi:helix-turn-helix domain-containing protein [Neisseria weixii]|uniref:Helix-turn-helix domain-containing protein n=1 Tax=Neisseria weixii TaxID=1853276 RepID=A0A3N4MVI9_9NEIS|nr:Cro/CI family transcriptional regulator [Neisseria weixii]RPD83209.1 helix-turn-helix domain-containing protein [Neisseria weixii]RPD89608.1 helix-turn-helix domain-containing protein [Neisseria weixii]
MRKALQAAIDFFGSQASLARKLGVQRSTVNSWVHGRNKIPPEAAVKIEKLTGFQVKKKELRPDLFDDLG